MVDTHWPELEIQASSVLSEQFFSTLCLQTMSLEKCHVLFDIVRLWSRVEANSSWTTGLLCAIARYCFVDVLNATSIVSNNITIDFWLVVNGTFFLYFMLHLLWES